MTDKNPKNEKLGRLIVAGFGLLWTIGAFSVTAGSPWPLAKIILPGFGILFIIGALTGHSSENTSSSNEKESSTMESPVEQFNPREMDSPGQTSRNEPPVQMPAPQPRQKGLSFRWPQAQTQGVRFCLIGTANTGAVRTPLAAAAGRASVAA